MPSTPDADLERKATSLAFLKAIKFPADLELAPLASASFSWRSPAEVAERCVILYGLLYVVYKEKPAHTVLAYFNKFNLAESLTEAELSFLKSPKPADELVDDVSWSIEALFLMLWSINLVDDLEAPVETCILSEADELPDFSFPPDDFISNATFRNEDEILDQADLHFRIQTQLAGMSPIAEAPIPADIFPDIAAQRHRAFQWILNRGVNW